ncbi:MAG: cation diffusion facilitator family transporter [Acidobacteria bacterium RIFCSPLOWO2_12_FULL_65_11]|nr:MAG: cation diffusion facilitator family transporter [Acidobacteria bacterium RIFCSPLOWO2_02_FULL_64_15]OFW27995.1 MAG: cation diffusion facilitator family transporter [Acidobacteria bacterium RIFCSPLOWO2_12_FULL_65_11]
MTVVSQSYRSARRVVLVGIAVSGMLSCSNIIIGLLAHSISVVATGFEFAGDTLASSIVLIGMRVAARPADEDHPYGHGRFETLSAFVVGVVLAAGGVMICYQSLQAIGEPHAPPGASAAVALVGAIVLRTIMSSVKFRVGRRLRSSALVADAWNDAVDILSALAALTAVGLATYDPGRFLAADHYGGFVVGIVVVITGIRVVRDASLELADTMPAPELTEEILRVARSVAGVQGVDKVFARKTGLQYHIDLHIEVDPALTVAASHAIAGHVRATLKRDLPWVADVLVHVEPAVGSG